MKRIFALLVCLCLLLCGCGEDPTTGNEGGGSKDEKLTTEKALKYAHQYDIDSNRHILVHDDGSVFVSVRKTDTDMEAAANWTDVVAVEIGVEVLYGLKKDGTITVLCPTVIQDDLNWDYSAFTDLIQVETAHNHAVYGLKKDGTVVATGDKAYDVSGWTDVVLLSAGGDSTGIIMGLRSDGTVLIEGYDSVLPAAQWTDIVHISAGRLHVAGVKADGTVVTAGHPLGEEDTGEFNVADWKDVIYVAAENQTTYGLKSDGTVVCTGRNAKDTYGEWTDIVCIYPGFNGLVGLRSDGTLTNYSSWWIFKK